MYIKGKENFTSVITEREYKLEDITKTMSENKMKKHINYSMISCFHLVMVSAI